MQTEKILDSADMVFIRSHLYDIWGKKEGAREAFFTKVGEAAKSILTPCEPFSVCWRSDVILNKIAGKLSSKGDLILSTIFGLGVIGAIGYGLSALFPYATENDLIPAFVFATAVAYIMVSFLVFVIGRKWAEHFLTQNKGAMAEAEAKVYRFWAQDSNVQALKEELGNRVTNCGIDVRIDATSAMAKKALGASQSSLVIN